MLSAQLNEHVPARVQPAIAQLAGEMPQAQAAKS